MFDPEPKKYRHDVQFPTDMRKCHEMGERLVTIPMGQNK